MATTGTGLAVTSALKPFAKQQVGNSINVTGGTNFNVGRYVIASISGVTATVVGPTNISTGVGAVGTGGLGGALLSPSIAASVAVASNVMFLKNDGSVFSVTSASSGTSQGVISTASYVLMVGYSTHRLGIPYYSGAMDSPPTIQVNVATTTLLSSSSLTPGFVNIIFDGNAQTACKLTGISSVLFVACQFLNFNTASTGANCMFYGCLFTGNSATVALSAHVVMCESYANTATAIVATTANWVIAYSNTGASTDGISVDKFGMGIAAVANGRDGVRTLNAGPKLLVNNYAQGNTGTGLNNNVQNIGLGWNNGTQGNGTATSFAFPTGYSIGPLALSGDAFTNLAGNDYSLNNLASQGAALRNAAIPVLFPRGLTSTYLDVGAARHQDPTAASNIFPIFD